MKHKDFQYVVQLENENTLLKQKISELQEELNRYKNRNSRNSSTPPSQDFKRNTPNSTHLGGAKPGHKAHQRECISDDKVDKIITSTCDRCPTCKTQIIRKTGATSNFQYVDLLDGKIHISNYNRIGYYCPCCRKRFYAPLPDNIGRSPFGPRLRAAVCTLTARFHLSKREVTDLFRDFFNFHISNGMVSKIEAATAAFLKPSYQKIRKEILNSQQPAYVDETRWRHARRNAYIWEISTKSHTLYQVHLRRNKEARDALLGNQFRQPLVTDRYCVYRNLDVPHQYCLTHLLRNFQSFAECSSIARFIGKGLVEQMKSVFRLWRLYRRGKIKFDELKRKCRYRQKTIKDLLKDGVFSSNKRLSRFSWDLLGSYDRMWTFLRIRDLGPTNNQAERDLRPMVLWRKKSFGTKGKKGMQFVAIVGSIVQTLKKQGKSVYAFISEVLATSHRQKFLLSGQTL